MKPTLSLSMIVRNEERHLARCLEHARVFADEIVILDTGSTDRTKAIAREFTDKIFDFVWIDDFAAARNQSLDRCTGDFVMYLDADDVVNLEDARRLRALFNRPIDWDLCRIPYILAGDGRGGVTKASRIWRNFIGMRWTYPIHEVIRRPPRPIKTEWEVDDIRVWHSPLQLEEFRPEKSSRNLGILEKALERDEYKSSAHLWYHLAKEHRSLREHENAVRAGFRSLELDKDRGSFVRSRILLLIADQLVRLQRDDEAFDALGRAIAEYPGWREPYWALAELQVARKHYDDALLLLKLGETIPRHRRDVNRASLYGAEWSDGVAKVLQAQGNLAGALEEIRRALTRDPESRLLLSREHELRTLTAAADRPPILLELTAYPPRVAPGETFTARFHVGSELALHLGLGLSIRHRETQTTYSDPARENFVECPAGEGVCSRTFQIPPSALPGAYDLVAALRAGGAGRLGPALAKLTKTAVLEVVATA